MSSLLTPQAAQGSFSFKPLSATEEHSGWESMFGNEPRGHLPQSAQGCSLPRPAAATAGAKAQAGPGDWGQYVRDTHTEAQQHRTWWGPYNHLPWSKVQSQREGPAAPLVLHKGLGKPHTKALFVHTDSWGRWPSTWGLVREPLGLEHKLQWPQQGQQDQARRTGCVSRASGLWTPARL